MRNTPVALEGASTDEFRKFVEKSQKMEEEFGQKMTEMRTRIEKLTKEAKKRDLEHAKQLTKMRAEVAKVKKGKRKHGKPTWPDTR